MTQTITIKLTDEIYKTIKYMAAKEGRPIEDVAVEWLASHRKPRSKLSQEELQEAWKQLRKFGGAASSGKPTGADNERIDADLIREYGSSHED